MKLSRNQIFFAVLCVAIIVMYFSVNSEKFVFLNRRRVPYYTTTFQAYPGKYMRFDSTRTSECLQRNQEYSGFRNCMLYLE